MTSRPPALQDVATRAGVSAQTVSRVLNEHPHVSASTRAAVKQAISDLGYRRNMSARMLATGRSNVIGVIAPSSLLYGPSSMVDGLSRAARAASMSFSVDHLVEFDEAAVSESIDRLLSHGVAGLLAVLPLDSAVATAATLLPGGTPLVTVDGQPDGGAGSVGVDQYGGAVIATEHLLATGHDTVWHVAGPADWNDSRAREAGWRDTLLGRGLELPPVSRGDWSPASGYEAGRMLARIPDCTAIFAANDHMALGVARALQEHGRRVPEDVRLVGFDDVPESAFYAPPLTTIHQDFAAVGRAGLELLIEQIETPGAAARSVLIPATLVTRASSAGEQTR
ncbi:LacI family DNA-binding transcriptional regulator [Jatrophihabitans endophyticus]|uniref:LacI family DNA-binding transcriptional regulator n=1 Tax=Jatrophihabitans endophyticus TaxID=1206085 RepID=UPI00190E8FD9|nr:LacI family DNA-binding transcriptional regulator [Jatrophihabitans endophyticus]